VDEICRKMGISQAMFYAWRKKFGGLCVAKLRRLRQLEEENRKLKQLVANLSLDKAMLQDVHWTDGFVRVTYVRKGHMCVKQMPNKEHLLSR